jgi:transposase-like protein
MRPLAFSHDVRQNLSGVGQMAGRSRTSRRRWSETFKKRVVAEASEPGATVAQIARRYDLDAPRVSNWMKKFTYGVGRLPMVVSFARRKQVSSGSSALQRLQKLAAMGCNTIEHRGTMTAVASEPDINHLTQRATCVLEAQRQYRNALGQFRPLRGRAADNSVHS